jgi:hypothetical protein
LNLKIISTDKKISISINEQLLINNEYFTFVIKSGFSELLIHSVRKISLHLEFSEVFMYTTHIGSDLENTSQSNKFLKTNKIKLTKITQLSVESSCI